MNQELLDALINYINKRADYAAKPADKNMEDMVRAMARVEEVQKRVTQ